MQAPYLHSGWTAGYERYLEHSKQMMERAELVEEEKILSKKGLRSSRGDERGPWQILRDADGKALV